MTTLGTWLLVAVTWIALSLIVSLAVGLLARVGGGEDGGE